jgi:hypothetical protein
MKAQSPESKQSFKVGQSAVVDGRSPESQSLNSSETDDMVQFRPGGRPIGTDSYEIHADDMADVIEADTIHEPSQPPGTSARIEVIFDVSVGPADGRDGVPLDVGAVDHPPQAACHDEYEDHQSPDADPQPPTASLGRSSLWHLLGSGWQV